MTLKGSLSGKNMLVKLLFWFGIMALLTSVTLVLWALLVSDKQSVSALKLLQVLQTFSVFVLPALMATWLWAEKPLQWLHLDRGFSWQLAVLVPLTVLILSPAINMLSVMNQHIELPSFMADIEQSLREKEDQATWLTELFARVDTVPALLLNLLIMAVLPALGEELCFRGTCQGLFPQSRPHVAIWCTAILFSAIHFQFYGFIPRMLLGALLGYLLYWSGSLYLPMLAHATNNAIAVVCFYMVEKGWVTDEAVDTLGSGDTLWVGLLSLVLGLIGVYRIWRTASRPQSSTPPLSAPRE